MKLIEPETSLQFNDCDPLIKLEKIGRVCYKSDSEYTRETAIAFIKSLIKRGHMSVLEHANFIFEGIFFRDKPFINSTYVVNEKTFHCRKLTSCNLRAIIEQKYYRLQEVLIKYYPELSGVFDTDAIERNIYKDSLIEDPVINLVSLSDFKDITEEEINAHLYTTFDFVTDRGVTHEMVRHRIASFTQESTRYCVAGDTELRTSNPHNHLTVKDLYENINSTKNGSYKRIKIKHLDEDTGELDFSHIKNIFNNGVKQVFELTTELGYHIKCTKDHEIYTPSGYLKLEDLEIGDKVYVNGIKIHRTELYKNHDWLYYQNITLNKTFVQIAAEFGYNTSTLKKWARKLNIPKKGTGYFNEGRKPWNKGLTELDDPRVKIQAEALRTYHCDGRHDGETLILKSDTVNYQKYLKDSCEICGAVHDLEVHHKDKNRDNNEQDNLLTVCESCHQRIHNMSLECIYEDKIVSIECKGFEEVYDIEMDSEYHNFVASGIVVHNCNYSNEKFGSEIKCIYPANFESWSEDNRNVYIHSLEQAEEAYISMIDEGATAQQARGVLPTDLATTIVMTANHKEWNHFFDLRSRGLTGSPHPNMKVVASKAEQLYYECHKSLFDKITK